MDIKERALKAHEEWKGKIEVNARCKIENAEDLTIAYTPGVAEPCLEISKDPDLSYKLYPPGQPGGCCHRRHRCAGPGRYRPGGRHAGDGGQMRPVQGFCRRGRASRCASAVKDVDDIVNTVRLLAGSFGGINLEDISAPRCFEIERRLKEVLRHPDLPRRSARHCQSSQLAAMINALQV